MSRTASSLGALEPLLEWATVQTLIIVGAIFTISFLYLSSSPHRAKIDAPCLDESVKKQKKRWSWDTTPLLQEAYTKFRGKVFQVFANDGPVIIIPYEMINEVKAFPDSILSVYAGISEALQPKHTTILVEEGSWGVTFLKSTFNRSLGTFIPEMKADLDRVISEQFQNYKDWTPIDIQPKLVPLIASMTASVFVGRKFSGDPVWLKTSTDYAADVFIAATILKFWPSSLRPITRYFTPHIWRIYSHNKIASRVVEESFKNPDNKKSTIHGIREILPDYLKPDYLYQGRMQLGFAAASLATTVRLVRNTFYDLAAHPEYYETLRDEIGTIAGPGPERTYTAEVLQNLKKLDSFMKEVMRIEAGGPVVFRRQVMEPITLSDGTYLPRNSIISLAASAIASDPALFPNPETFDGLRYYNLRQRSEEDKNRHQLVTLDNANLGFSSGRHACPGRFFASASAKMVVAELIMKYDFKLKGGEERPKDWVYQSIKLPRPAEILIRNREVE